MKGALLLAIVAGCVGWSPAHAQSCTSYPYTLTNGQSADATQVMANFNYVLNCATTSQTNQALQGYLAGLTLSNDLINPNTVIDTAKGIATSDDASVLMQTPALTKNANAAWSVGSGNGCLVGGSALTSNTWYHIFLIVRTDTNVVDEICSSSLTPTLPTPYSKKRRIGSFRANAAAQITPFRQNGDEFLWFAAVNDINAGGLVTTSRTPVTLTVPTGVRVNAIVNLQISPLSSIGSVILTSLDQSDNRDGLEADLVTGASQYVAGRFNIKTDTNGAIGLRAITTPSTYWVSTRGWIDTRGRFD